MCLLDLATGSGPRRCAPRPPARRNARWSHICRHRPHPARSGCISGAGADRGLRAPRQTVVRARRLQRCRTRRTHDNDRPLHDRQERGSRDRTLPPVGATPHRQLGHLRHRIKRPNDRRDRARPLRHPGQVAPNGLDGFRSQPQRAAEPCSRNRRLPPVDRC